MQCPKCFGYDVRMMVLEAYAYEIDAACEIIAFSGEFRMDIDTGVLGYQCMHCGCRSGHRNSSRKTGKTIETLVASFATRLYTDDKIQRLCDHSVPWRNPVDADGYVMVRCPACGLDMKIEKKATDTCTHFACMSCDCTHILPQRVADWDSPFTCVKCRRGLHCVTQDNLCIPCTEQRAEKENDDDGR